MNKTYDVIIAGAGPVGLFLSCELALAKCSVLILEKDETSLSPLKKIPFGIRGLAAPSIESLDRRGLLGELEIHKQIKNPHQNTGMSTRRQLGHFAGIPFHEGDVDTSRWKHRLPSSTAPILISEMQELEIILVRRAESLGVEIKRGYAATDFQQNGNKVKVRAGDHYFECKYLVGCDGGRSAVRKRCGFDFVGTEPEFTGYSTHIEIADPEKLKSGRNLTSSGMYLQSQPGFLIMQDFDGGRFHQSEKPVTIEHVQEVLRRISQTDVAVTDLHIATTWTDRARQATKYRDRRIFLAGDAAHIHSPLGGQGLNLGIGDAMNLGWKLAAVIKDSKSDTLLDSYQDERHPLGAQVLDWSRAQVAIMRPDPHARALHSIVRDLMNTPDGATLMAAKVWGIHTRYNLEEAHPLVGGSVPNFEFGDGRKIADFMRDGRGLLIDFEKNLALKNLACGYKNMTYLGETAKERLGLRSLLVRPDGIVAWLGESDLDLEAAKRAANLWFTK